MKLRSILLFWAVLFIGTATAQMADDQLYYPYAEAEEERELPVSDYTLFERALASSEELYTSITTFQLPQVSLRRRGEHFSREETTLLGLEADYRHASLLRALGYAEQRHAGIAFDGRGLGGAGGAKHFRWSNTVPLQPFRVAARYSDHSYRAGAQFAYRAEHRSGWLIAAATDLRTGRDARIEGVFTNQLHAGVSLQRAFDRGGRMALVALLPYAQRGLRSASTEEAFRLTDDPYYNPAWGLQDGRVRNSRVRREFLPRLTAAWEQPLAEGLALQVTAMGGYTLRKQSGMGWYDARTPHPDNYRKMPSYTGDRANEEAWRRADPHYTQLPWDELIEQNRLTGGAAHYALEDRCTAAYTGALRLALHLQRVGFECRGGWLSSYRNSRNYKEMRDLLGADYLLDVDHFLIDDDTYANRLENNLRAPSRHIAEGDRFGYDYALVEQHHGLWLHALHGGNRLRVEVAAELRHAEAHRRGYYEKELFAGRASYGTSRRIALAPYTFKAAFGWSFSPRYHLQLTAAVGGEMPRAEQLFVQPLYNNRTIDDPTLERYQAVELRLRSAGERLDWQLAAFATLRYDGVERRSTYDDLAGAYCNLVVDRISTSALGLEAAMQWRMSYRWRLDAAASVGRYRYTEDPRLTLLRDTDNAVVEEHAVSHAADCRPGGTPSLTATLGLNYYGRAGWGGRLSAGFVAGRYVDPAWTRRTERVAHQNGAGEEFVEAFTHQEELDEAFTLDCSLYKTIRFDHAQLQLTLMVRNITAAEYATYGYESMRTQRAGSAVGSARLPQATRYLYAAPRSILLTVGYRF